MENTIEKKVKTKRWEQYIFQMLGVAEQVKEEVDEEISNSMSKFCLSYSIFFALWHYPINSIYRQIKLHELYLISCTWGLFIIRQQAAHDPHKGPIPYHNVGTCCVLCCMLTANWIWCFHLRVRIRFIIIFSILNMYLIIY